MISKPILIVRMPLDFGEEYQQILSDEFSEELDGQYNVFVLSEETEDRKIKFEVHGVPNSSVNEGPTNDSGSFEEDILEPLRKWSDAKKAQDQLNKQRAEEAEAERKKGEILPLTDWEINELRYLLRINRHVLNMVQRGNDKEPVTI